MKAFAAGSAYDPVVNKMPGISTVSYAELTVQCLPPLAVDPMHNARRRRQR
jgi:hypothetical protein